MSNMDAGFFSEREANALMSFYAGMDYAYDQLNSLISTIDPEVETHEMQVISNYLDAWWTEMNYKREQVGLFLDDMKRKRMSKLLKNLGASENIESIEFAPEFIDEINEKCRAAINEVFNKYLEEGEDATP